MHPKNRYLITYIDSVKKERAAYPKHNNFHIENVAKITIDSDSVNPQKKKRIGRLSERSSDSLRLK